MHFHYFPFHAVSLALLAATQLLSTRVHAQTTAPEQAQSASVESGEEESSYESTAEVKAPPHEATKHQLEQEQLTTIPGTRGDALRAIEILPGVGRTPFASNPGAPPLRGSSASESLVLLDGASIPLLYHFGGLTSVFNSQLLESVTLYPGNYSVRYGRASGGIVDARVRDPRSDASHVMLELSAIDASALVEVPLGESTQIALAARRSTVDLFFDALVTDDSTAVIAAPVYWDYQAIVAHRFSPQHKLRLIAYGGLDAFELHFGEALADDPALQGEFGSKVSFHRLQLELDSELTSNVTQRLMLATGRSPGSGQLGTLNYKYDAWESQARGTWTILAAPWLSVDAGFDAQLVNVQFRYQGPAPAPDDGVPSQGAFASQSGGLFEGTLNAARPGAFVEASLRPVPGLLVVPGVRADYYADMSAWTVDPRMAARLELGPITTLKAAAGSYSQPPRYWEVMPGFGNPQAKPSRALHASVGVEQYLSEQVRLDTDIFYKHWEDRIVSTPGGAPPRFVNGGTGDAYGLEMLLNVQLTQKSQAFVAYTLSRSTRQDGPGQASRLLDDDQTHNVSLAASYDLGAGWLAGARFRYVTGNPYSAVSGSVYDASTDTYLPLYGAINGARNPAFHQLDLRVDKLWVVGPVNLTCYLEIMNVYNRANQESRRYSFDYQESASVAGLPFFPNLGFKGEL